MSGRHNKMLQYLWTVLSKFHSFLSWLDAGSDPFFYSRNSMVVQGNFQESRANSKNPAVHQFVNVKDYIREYNRRHVKITVEQGKGWYLWVKGDSPITVCTVCSWSTRKTVHSRRVNNFSSGSTVEPEIQIWKESFNGVQTSLFPNKDLASWWWAA